MKKIILLLSLLAFWSAQPGFSADDARIQALERQIAQLQQQTQSMQGELQALKTQRAPEVAPVGSVAAVSEEAQAESNVVVTGYADVLFQKKEGVDGTFMVGHYNPIFLYRFGDRLLAEAELEIEPRRSPGEESELEFALEYLTIDYTLCDYMTLIAGKFLLPVGVFNEKIHPAWINKLPSKPLPYAKHMLPDTQIGIQGRGAIHAGDAVISYTLLGSNGPTSVIEEEVETVGGVEVTTEEESLELEDGNFQDNNGNKAVGGRGAIFYPFDRFSAEVGLSGLIGNYDNAGDLAYSAIVIDGELHALENLLEIRSEGLFTKEETLTGEIDRTGFYVQAAYKLAAIDAPIISSTELVFRYSLIRSDAANADQDQFSIGGNYYFTNTFIGKVAYDFNEGDTSSADADMFNIQLAYGF